MFEHFQHGGHEPEAVISHHQRTYQDRVNSYIIAFAHDKSDGMYATSVHETTRCA